MRCFEASLLVMAISGLEKGVTRKGLAAGRISRILEYSLNPLEALNLVGFSFAFQSLAVL